MKATIIQTTENGEPQFHVCEIRGYDVNDPKAEVEFKILNEVFSKYSPLIKRETEAMFAALQTNEKVTDSGLSINLKCDWLDEPIHTKIYSPTTGKEYILSGYYQDATGNEHFTHEQAIEIGERIPGWRLCTDEFHKALADAVFDDNKWKWKENVCGTKLNGFEYLTKVLKYKLGGYRNVATGALTAVGNNGYSWSSSVSGIRGLFLLFSASGLNPSHPDYRAYGFQVRCLQE